MHVITVNHRKMFALLIKNFTFFYIYPTSFVPTSLALGEAVRYEGKTFLNGTRSVSTTPSRAEILLAVAG